MMSYYICLVIGGCVGFVACALIVANGKDDTVKPVRCRDCLYRSQYPDSEGRYGCGAFCTEDGKWLFGPEFFCAWGERRMKDGK